MFIFLDTISATPVNDKVLTVEKVNTVTPSEPRERLNDEKPDGKEWGLGVK